MHWTVSHSVSPVRFSSVTSGGNDLTRLELRQSRCRTERQSGRRTRDDNEGRNRRRLSRAATAAVAVAVAVVAVDSAGVPTSQLGKVIVLIVIVILIDVASLMDRHSDPLVVIRCRLVVME